MGSLPKHRKAYSRITSKRVSRAKANKSVTEQIPDPNLDGKNALLKPRQQSERLVKWLEIANGASIGLIKFDEILFDLRAKAFFEPVERSVRASLDRIVRLADVI